MKFWFDTEFLEDGRTIQLISIGVVAEDGRHYYAETETARLLADSTDWLRHNVLPHLRGGMLAKPRAHIRKEIVDFMGEAPEIWAYYADYDWVALCQLYGTMMHLPKGWPMYCRDVKQWADQCGNLKLPEQVGKEHHALADALWTKEAWLWLRGRAALMPIYGATEDPSAAELAVGQIVTIVTVADDGVKTERVPWSEIMNPPTKPDFAPSDRWPHGRLREPLPEQTEPDSGPDAAMPDRGLGNFRTPATAPSFEDQGADVLGERKDRS